jgi:hypothetical protein
MFDQEFNEEGDLFKKMNICPSPFQSEIKL